MNINTLDINYIGSKKHNDLFERILKESLEEEEIEENQVKLCTLYIEDGEEEVTASLAMLNALDRKVNFDKMQLIFIGDDEKVLAKENVDLNFLGVLPAKTVTPFEMKFPKSDFAEINCDVTKLKIKFGTSVSAHASTKISNFEADGAVSFNDKVAAKIYLKEEAPMQDNSMSVKAFNPYIKDEKLVVPVMVINSYSEDAKVAGFNLQLLDHIGMAKATKKIKNEIRVKAKSATLTLITFEEKELLVPKEELVNYKVIVG